jgi:hypothetical protein
MPSNKILSDVEMDDIISGLKKDPDMVVIHGPNVKRPSRIQVISAEDSLTVESIRMKEREKSRSSDKLIKLVQSGVSDPHVLSMAAGELAEEIHALKFEREKLEAQDKDITPASGKRVVALKALIDTAIKVKEMSGSDPIDFGSGKMQILLNLIFTKINASLMDLGFSDEIRNAFFQVYTDKMASFEVEAQKLIDQEVDII